MNKKDRKHSGRYTPKATISKKEIIENNIEIQIEYDDWNNYRDSFRDKYKDNKQIKAEEVKYRKYINENDIKRIKYNNKQKLLLKRRKARRVLNRLKNT